jgi:DNA-directed RNA polymerase subunit F
MTSLYETARLLTIKPLSCDEIREIFNEIAYKISSYETTREERNYVLKVLEDLGKL